MYVIEVRNVAEAFPKGIELLMEHGVREDSRAGPVLVMPYPVTTVYNRPQERVLFSAVRDANPVFHLLEAIWMLAGRNDSAFLNQYVRDFGHRFAELDGIIHDAYGYRWRHAFGFDQIDAVVAMLRRDPHSRQAVLQMWDARPMTQDDLLGEWKTRPCNTHIYLRVHGRALDITVCCRSNDILWGCLAKDTLILSPEGDISISSLATRFQLGLRRFPVYAVDPLTGNMALKWCIKAWKTGRKPIRELKFDDGTKLRLTKDHILYRKKTRRGVHSVAQEVILETPAGELKVGDRIWAPGLLTINGRTGLKLNILKGTEFSNVRPVSRAYDELLNGPCPSGFHVHHKDGNIQNDRASNLERMTGQQHMSLHMSEKMNSLSPQERKILARKGSLAAAETVAKMSLSQRQELYKKRSIGVSERMKKYHAKFTPEERRHRARQMSELARSVVTLEMQQENGRKGSASRWKDPEQRRKQSELMKRLNREGQLRSNHKIVAIRDLPPEDVYDFTVEDYHTALVGNGILVHNCYGSNAVHFSILQEYLAARIGVDVGTYTQISNNYHAYTDVLDKLEFNDFNELEDQRYPGIGTMPLVDNADTFDAELSRTLGGDVELLTNRFLAATVYPAMQAHAHWRARQHIKALAVAARIVAPDWRAAIEEWMQRRMK